MVFLCGICGFNWEDKTLIKGMADSLAHRGPDSDGFFIGKEISLGMRRLRIIDLKGGEQPIFNEDRTKCIVFNGEIYNFKEIRELLIKKGHRFYTNSDTEAILHSYEEYGRDCVSHLRGMFGFAIWDIKEKTLFIARDRIGVKPVYYTISNGNLVFASEIKSILQCKSVDRKVNETALHYYLTFRYVPGNNTLFDGIFKLPPGHTLTLHKGEIKIQKYWDVTIGHIKNESEAYFSKQLLESIKESINIRLISDVPFGAYLSGGLDSSTIVAIMQSFLNEPVKTFSVGFDAGKPFNELDYARLVSDRFGTEHSEVVIKANDLYMLPEVIWHLDDPVVNPLILISQYKLSQLAKKKVSMVLIGEGADELFAGYAEFKFHKMLHGLKSLPKFVKKNVIPKVVDITPDFVSNSLFNYGKYFGDAVKNRLRDLAKNLDDVGESYLALRAFFSYDDKKAIFNDKLFEKEQAIDYMALFKPYFSKIDTNFLDTLILADVKERLPNFLLHSVDKMTMAHGLEGRVPFVDHKLAELSFTIPSGLKLKGTNVKYILKKSMAGVLPKEILKRKKHPFTNPVHGDYARTLKELAARTLGNSEICGKYFKKEMIRRIIGKYDTAPMYYYRQLSSIVTLDIWHKIYIEQDDFKNPCLDFNKLY